MLDTLTALACFLAFCAGVALLRHMRRRPYQPEPMEYQEPPVRVRALIWDGFDNINERETP